MCNYQRQLNFSATAVELIMEYAGKLTAFVLSQNNMNSTTNYRGA
jgi:hypothetical protein